MLYVYPVAGQRTVYFKQRYNCYFRQIGPHRNGIQLELQQDQFAEWLGTIDRSVAKIMPGAKEVPLDFSGWRLGELDKWQWISENVSFVGCLIEGGVFAVVDYEKPLLKRRPDGQERR